MSNASNAPQKNRRGVTYSCSVLLFYLIPPKFISEMYPNIDKCDALIWIVITSREVRIVTRREQLYIFMRHEDSENSEFYYVQMWFRVDTKGSDEKSFVNIEEKEGKIEVAVESGAWDTPIHAMA